MKRLMWILLLAAAPSAWAEGLAFEAGALVAVVTDPQALVLAPGMKVACLGPLGSEGSWSVGVSGGSLTGYLYSVSAGVLWTPLHEGWRSRLGVEAGVSQGSALVTVFNTVDFRYPTFPQAWVKGLVRPLGFQWGRNTVWVGGLALGMDLARPGRTWLFDGELLTLGYQF